ACHLRELAGDRAIVARTLDGAARRQPVRRPVELEVVPDAVLAHRVHRGAPVVLDRHPALALEPDQRFADRDAADAELLRDRGRRHAPTGLESAVEDLPSDVEGGAVRTADAVASSRQLVLQCRLPPCAVPGTVYTFDGAGGP